MISPGTSLPQDPLAAPFENRESGTSGPIRWAVVGGGMLGLGVANHLIAQGESVTLFECGDSVGGLTSAWKIGDVTWDRYYHVTLLSDVYLRGVLQTLDLEKDMEWVQTKTGFFSNGKLHSLSSSIEFLKFPVLNLFQKFRLGGTIFFGSKLKNWKELEKIPVEKWLQRWSGKSTFEKIWRPLLQCKLGEAYTRTNAAFIWAYIQRMYAARRSGMKREMFGYVRGGYDRVLNAFAKHLAERGVVMRTRATVNKVRSGLGNHSQQKDAPKYSIEFETENGTASESFDRVIMTVPSPAITKIVEGLADDERQRLEQTEYLGVVCTSLLLDRPLGGYYVTNITDPGFPVTGVIEMGTILKPEQLSGNYLVYVPKYVMSDHPAIQESDEAIHQRCIETLQRLYPDFSPDQVRAIRTAKAKYVMALPTLNYSSNRCPVVADQAGLYLLNSARIVDGTLNVNEVLRLVDMEMRSSVWPAHQQLVRLAN
jgi:protoporphyrinogen oxidase